VQFKVLAREAGDRQVISVARFAGSGFCWVRLPSAKGLGYYHSSATPTFLRQSS